MIRTQYTQFTWLPYVVFCAANRVSLPASQRYTRAYSSGLSFVAFLRAPLCSPVRGVYEITEHTPVLWCG
jgi:hypothetical protein